MNQRKTDYTMSEMIIILTSQYYNIVDLDKIIPDLNPIEYDIPNMKRQLLSICESFQKNLKSINEDFSWPNKDEQLTSVERVKKSCQDYLNV